MASSTSNEKRSATNKAALIGLSGRFPGAPTADALIEQLEAGFDGISEIPADRWDWQQFYSENRKETNKSVSRWLGVVDQINGFDNGFFGISAKNARTMDPQQRLLLQEAWHCHEDAGVSASELAAARTGVYVGVMATDYQQVLSDPRMPVEATACLGTYGGILANRVSHELKLTGPSVTVDAACASSLIALDQARRAIEDGICDFALVAGVSLNLDPWKYLSFSRAGMLSPTGRCHTFDVSADGYVPGDGIVTVLLERNDKARRERRRIYALVQGSAVNHCGETGGITRPSNQAQADVIEKALCEADLGAHQVGYWEAHGTGTSLGDPIEVAGLAEVYNRTKPKRAKVSKTPRYLGSLKSNIGHLEAAAGLAGVVKVVKMMQRRRIVPTVQLSEPNPLLDLEGARVRLARKGTAWRPLEKGEALRAGVSSFGMGGANSHAILEAPSPLPTRLKGPRANGEALPFMLSAATPNALANLLSNWRTVANSDMFEKLPLKDICGTLAVGREALPHRYVTWVRTHTDLRAALESADFTETGAPCLGFSLPNHKLRETNFKAWQTVLKQKADPKKSVIDLWGELLETFAVQGIGVTAWSGAVSGLAALEARNQLISPLDGSFHPSVELGPSYFAKLKTQLEVETPDLFQTLVERAKILLGHQVTFGRFLEEWSAPVLQRGMPTPRGLLIKGDTHDRILPLIVLDCITKLALKWSLNATAELDISAHRELISLLHLEILDHQSALALLLDGTLPETKKADIALNNLPTMASSHVTEARQNGYPKSWASLDAPNIDVVTVSDPTLDHALEALAAVWQRGAHIDWSALFPKGSYKVCSLPRYPFEKNPFPVSKNDFDLSEFEAEPITSTKPVSAVAKEPSAPTQTGSKDSIEARLVADITAITELNSSDINVTQNFLEMGIDSLELQEFTDRLDKQFSGVSQTVLYTYTTIATLAEHLSGLTPKTAYALETAAPPASPAVKSDPADIARTTPTASDGAIAIVGMSGRFPKAPDIWHFWDNLAEKRDCVEKGGAPIWSRALGKGPEDPRNQDRFGGYLNGVDRFDAMLFKIAPNDANLMDPQQRLSLECAWSTLEHAGYGQADAMRGTPVGVFWGSMWGEYSLYAAEQGYLQGAYGGPGAINWAIANRISYFFDFTGPSLMLDTACSSSLTALHMGCQAIRAGDCEAALVGGVNLSLHPAKYDYLSEGMFLSAEGKCRSFGDGGDGYVPGEGVGAVLLKPLAQAVRDGDRVYGVVKASSVNHGGNAAGFTAPNPRAQQTLIETALARSGLKAADIGLIECHGTGTALGDPIEIEALSAAYATSDTPIPIGSVKSNIGHLEAAAGIAGLIKLLLAFENQWRPASLHHDPVNRRLDFDKTPFRLLSDGEPWAQQSGSVRHAAISSFGAGGSNAHVILSGPEMAVSETRPVVTPGHAVLSARSEESLRALARQIADILGGNNTWQFADIAHTLAKRAPAACIADIPAGSPTEVLEHLHAIANGVPQPATRHVDKPAAEAHAHILSLPPTPFERQSYWIPTVATQQNIRAAQFPALEPAGKHTVVISLDAHQPCLSDHEIGDAPVLAAAMGIELAIRAKQILNPTEAANLHLSKLSWAKPVVSRSKTEIRLTSTGANFELQDSNGPSMRGRWSDASTPWPVMDFTIDAPTLDVEAHYRDLASAGMKYGPSYRTIRDIRFDGRHLEARVRETESSGWTEGSTLSPVLVDGALQALLMMLRSEKSVVAAVPVSIDRVFWQRPLTDEILVRAQIEPAMMKGMFKADILLCDPSGTPLSMLCGVMLRAIDPKDMVPSSTAKSAARQPVAYHKLIWADLPDEAALETSVVRISETPAWFTGIEAAFPVWQRAPANGLAETVILPLRDPEGTAPQDYLWHVISALQKLIADGAKRILLIAPHGRRSEAVSGILRAIREERPTLEMRLLLTLSTPDASAIISQARRQWAGEPEVLLADSSAQQRTEVPIELPVANQMKAQGAWLITGGLGKLGLLFCEHLADKGVQEFLLLGRKVTDLPPETIRRLSTLEQKGVSLTIQSVDVADEASMAQLLSEYGKPLKGVMHCAGVTRDKLLLGKTEQNCTDVARGKVTGAEVLDKLTANISLDAFILFSSIVSVRGNLGQSDYAYANRTLDLLAEERASLVAEGKRTGISLSINWPLWAEGGMSVADDRLDWLVKNLGSGVLSTEAGIRAFDAVFTAQAPQALVTVPLDDVPLGDAPAVSEEPVTVAGAAHEKLDLDTLKPQLCDHLIDILADETGFDRSLLDGATSFDNYGVDSVISVAIVNRLEKYCGKLSKVLLFEYPTVDALCDYLCAEHGGAAKRMVTGVAGAATTLAESTAPTKSKQSTPVPETRQAGTQQPASVPQLDDIAIIGLAGRYPDAQDLEAFWANLKAGVDATGSVPENRWHTGTQMLGPNGEGTFGAFLDDIDMFDPLVFGISPKDARLMDPQTRLFLEASLHALEDAGFAGRVNAQNVGVFAAAMWSQYQMAGTGVADGPVPNSSFAEIANRVSHCFDLHGPSLTVDTMCSSSVTALHLAADALRTGQCEMALAGGVNLSLRPEKYRQLIEGSFLSEDGKCRSFGEGGSGYVPGEGVGVAVLKRLGDARRDRDRILGVIKGSALNHGGGDRGFTVPSPNAQAQVISQALERAKVLPEDLGYIETHGTGTSLGDPIEVAGLTKAFASARERAPRKYWRIGSVKSQIGHLEAAAGMAALTKVILQFAHKTIAPSLHSETPNQNIDWAAAPFDLIRNEQPAKDLDTVLISSFGAGGSNSALIVGSAPGDSVEETAQMPGPYLFPLSARTERSLRENAANLYRHLNGTNPANGGFDLIELLSAVLDVDPGTISDDSLIEDLGLDMVVARKLIELLAARTGHAVRTHDLFGFHTVGELASALRPEAASSFETIDLAAVAFTLQVGRLPLQKRALITAPSMPVLLEALNALASGAHHSAIVSSKDAGQKIALIDEHYTDPEALASAWAGGARVDWLRLYRNGTPRPVALPAYAFDRKSHWYEASTKPEASGNQHHRRPVSAEPQQKPAVLDDWKQKARGFKPTTVDLTFEGGVAVVRMHSDNRNMFDEELTLSLIATFEKIAAHPGARVVVLTGTSEVFSMGGTPEMLKAIAAGTANFTDVPFYYRGLGEFPLPVIAAMEGHAYGGGLLFGLYSDIPIMARESLYSAVFADYGFSPGMGATQLLPERFGNTLATEMMYSARALNGAELERRGVSVKIADKASVLGEAMQLARSLAQKPKVTLETMKHGFVEARLTALPQTIASEVAMHAKTFTQKEVRDRLDAIFKDKKATAQAVGTSPKPKLVSKPLNPEPAPERSPVFGKVSLRPIEQKTSAPQAYSQTLITVREALARILMTETYEIDNDTTFLDHGLDSIGATELVRDLNASLSANCEAASLYDHPTPAQLAGLYAREGTTSAPVTEQVQERVAEKIALRALDARPNSATKNSAPEPDVGDPIRSVNPTPPASTPQSDVQGDVQADVVADISGIVCRLLQMDHEDLDIQEPLMDQGLDSIGGVELVREINGRWQAGLEASDLYDYPTVTALSSHVAKNAYPPEPAGAKPHAPAQVALSHDTKASGYTSDDETTAGHIAIIGMACRYPGADDHAAFWRNILAGVDSIKTVPADRWNAEAFHDTDPEAENKSVTKTGGFLSDIKRFDADFFKISPLEARAMDPQARITLEECWHALEDAGLAPEKLKGLSCGLFLGAANGDYEDLLAEANESWTAEAFTGLSPAVLAARIAYQLDLVGPAVSIDTACSSSLVAVHQARRALLGGDCDMAIAGGVIITATPKLMVKSSKTGMLSPTGRCRPFSSDADGIALAEGVGLVVLKRLDAALRDGDQIHAVIEASGVNQDGRTNGITAPSTKSQAALIRKVQAEAGITADGLDYIEAHGTGTNLGDPIEVKALHECFNERTASTPIYLGSVKANIGHSTVAAGVAGLIKAVKVVQNGQVPPQPYTENLNERLSLDDSALAISTSGKELVSPQRPYRAAISSFGFSGTNAHVILRGPDALKGSQPSPERPLSFLLTAKSETALIASFAQLANWLESEGSQQDLTDIAFTLYHGRQRHEHVAVVEAEDRSSLLAALRRGPAACAAVLPEAPVNGRRVHLPGYPFEGDHHWVTAVNQAVPEAAKTKTAILDTVTMQDGIITTVSRFIEDEPIMNDHRGPDGVILAGASYAALVLEATAQAELGASIALTDLTWRLPLVARPDGKIPDLVTLIRKTPDPDVYGFSACSAEDDHAFGRVLVTEGNTGTLPASVEVARLQDGTIRSFGREKFYEAFAAKGLMLKGAFAQVECVYAGDDHAVAKLCPPVPEGYGRCDPGRLDSALQVVSALIDPDLSGTTLYLPVGIRELRLPRGSRDTDYVVARRCEGAQGAQLHAFDLDFHNRDGECVGIAHGFSLQAVERNQSDSTTLYVPYWEEVPRIENHGVTPRTAILAGTDATTLYIDLRNLIMDEADKGGHLVLVTDQEDAAHAIAGFARSFMLEDPRLRLSVLLNEGVAVNEALLETIAAKSTQRQCLFDSRGPFLKRQLFKPTPMTDPDQAAEGPVMITGGLGSIGLLLAESFVQNGVQTVLVTRRAPNASENQRLNALTPAPHIVVADITDPKATQVAFESMPEVVRIIHCAGVLRDALLINKAANDAEDVIGTKVDGLKNVLAALPNAPAGGVVCFSSVAAVFGQRGQTDYAFANGWLDGMDDVTSINWPWWQDGGMPMSEDVQENAKRETGIAPLAWKAGWRAFHAAIGYKRAMVLHGNTQRISRWLAEDRPVTEKGKSDEAAASSAGMAHVTATLGDILIDVLKLKPDALEPTKRFEDYGFDSITLTRYANRISRRMDIALSPAVFFEADTLGDLSQLVAERFPQATQPNQSADSAPKPTTPSIAASHTERPAQTNAGAVPPVNEPEGIAVVGMSGRFPGSPDIASYWQNLMEQADLIDEIPASRWDAEKYYGPLEPGAERTNSKWGGFIEDVDLFDAKFFGISPREAELMDPQQRLFLETAWHAVEDGGKNPKDLAGSKTGIFVGVATSDYWELVMRAGLPIEPHIATGLSHSMLPNRISFLMDLHGPSEPVDTACSSSLVAIARAVAAIQRGDCDAAIAGGVNIMLSPTLYLAFGQAGMLSPTGRCHTFDKAADGYVRGEGVGAVYLKSLSRALADGDPIHAVIKGIGVNHGGRANSLTAPNPKAQAQLIRDVMARHNIAPESIGFVECHGTGTQLGDPVELIGLSQSVATRENREHPVFLSSVKSNIGHLEAAAGVAGIIKTVLTVREGMMPGLVHFNEINPHAHFDRRCLQPLASTQAWPADHDQPRRAGVSSFAFGGANAHAIVESFDPALRRGHPEARPRLAPTVFERKRFWAQGLKSVATQPKEQQPAAKAPTAYEGHHFQIEWKPLDLQANNMTVGGNVLLLRGQEDWSLALSGLLTEGFSGALREATFGGPTPDTLEDDRLVLMVPAIGDEDDADEFQKAYETVLEPVRRLLKLRATGVKPLSVTVVYQENNALGAAISGMAQSVSHERPGWVFRAVEFAGEPSPARLVGALNPSDGFGESLRLEAESLFERSLAAFPETSEDGSDISNPDLSDKVVVILGGSGGIAGALIDPILKRGAGAIVLMGRRSIDQDIAHRLQLIKRTGCRAEYIKVDATDGPALHHAFQRTRLKIGEPGLIINGTMVLKDSPYTDMSAEDFQTVFNAKALVAANLEKILTQGCFHPDAVLHMSSVQSLIGNAGQANYAAACRCLDVKARQSQFNTTVINWGYWGDVGAVADDHHRAIMKAAGVQSISVEDGMHAIDRCLRERLQQLIVAKGTPKALARLGLNTDANLNTDPRPESGLEALDQLTVCAVASALMEQASSHPHWDDGEAWRNLLNVHPDQEKLLYALLAHIEGATHAITAPDWNAVQDSHPEFAGHVALLKEATNGLCDVLRGTKPGADVLFPNGSPHLIEAIYRGNILVEQANALVGQHAATHRNQGAARLIEIGAGTGGTSRTVLRALKDAGGIDEYRYTDVGQNFLLRAETELSGQYDFLKTSLFDIRRDNETQGIGAGAYDIALAANVLHAIPDVTEALMQVNGVLQMGGTIALVELTEVLAFNTAVFGLLPDWWSAADPSLRLPHSPLLSVQAWRESLGDAGFSNIQVSETSGPISVITAVKSADVAKTQLPTAKSVTRGSAAKKASANASSALRDKVREVFAVVLRMETEQIDLHTSISDMGIDSILAGEAAQRLGQVFDIEIRPTELFNHPSIEKLSQRISDLIPASFELSPGEEPSEEPQSSLADDEDPLMDLLIALEAIDSEDLGDAATLRQANE